MSRIHAMVLALLGVALVCGAGCTARRLASRARAPEVHKKAKAVRYAEAPRALLQPAAEEKAAADRAATAATGVAWASLGQKLIRTGTVRLEVPDAQEAHDRVVLLTARFGGFVAGNTLGGSPERGYQATVVLRLPSERLDEAVRALREIGEVKSIQIQGQNVTQEYVDLVSRLATKRQEEAVLLDIMKRRGTLSDILQVERELSRVRGEIEQAQGRLNYLSDQVALSTLTVEITQEPAAPPPGPVEWKLAKTAKFAWRATVRGLSAICRAGLWLGITAVIWLPILFILSLPAWLPARLRKRNRGQPDQME